ncbi:MAG: hypothetical protein JWP01_526 [Myxococcales bacterium]|nr:hypothetical protein [Myxococcales bacterium]
MRSPGLLAGLGILVVAVAPVRAAPKVKPPRAAAWVSPSLRDDQPAPYIGTRVLAVGQHAAIGVLELYPPNRAKRATRSKVVPRVVMHLAYDPGTGVRGPLKIPKGATWVGLGADDVVLAATANGTLWSAESIDAAIAGRFVQQGRVAGAQRWDAHPTAKIVLATAGRSIAISADGGRSFTRVIRPRPLEAAFVRADGIIVADPKGAPPEVSRDRGVTWTSAPAEVGSLVLARNGNWIGERDSDGAVTCRSGALADDGATWVSWEYWHEEPGGVFQQVASIDGLHGRWNQRLLDHPDYRDNDVAPATNSQTDPMPKAVAGDLAAFHARCKPDPDGGSMGDLLGMLSGFGEPECQGADCVSTEVQQVYRTQLIQTRVFHDGSLPARSASAVIVDLRSGRSALLVPPAGCISVLFGDLGGAAVLECRAGDGADLHLAGLDGVWHPAGHIAGVLPTRAHRATDGTIVLTPRCRTTSRDCGAWVRRPAPLDDAAVFERVQVPGARAFGALPGGKVLVAAVAPATGDDRSRIYLNGGALIVDDPKHPAPARPAALTEKLRKVADCFHALGAGRQSGEVALHWTRRGTVIDSGPPELRSCTARVIGTLPSTIADGNNVLYFRVIKQAIDLLEVAPGRPAVPIARDLAFDGALTNIALDARGEITFSADRARPYVSTTYRVDRASGTAKPLPAKN